MCLRGFALISRRKSTPGEYQLASIQEWTTARKVAAALGFDRARTLAEQKIHDLQVARAILASSEPRVQADVLSIENIQHPISGMQANMIVVKDISLAPPHVPGSIPQVAVGLSTLNVDCSAHARVRTEVSVTNESSFRVAISSWADSTVYAAGVNWLAVPQATGIQTGCAELFLPIHSGRLRDKSSDPVQLAHIRFTRAYSGPPKIVCWLTGLDIDPANTYRLRTWATDVTPGGFTLCAQTWMHSLLHGVGACWLAIPQDAPGVFVGEYRATMDVRSGYVEFPLGMFNVTPKAVVGLTKIDFRSKINLRARAVVKNVTTEGFTWEVQTWDDSHMYAAEITVVVVETAA